MRALVVLLLLATLTGCAGGSARHADMNRDYARNCGEAMYELDMCDR